MKQTIVYLHGLNCSAASFNYLISHLPKHESILINYSGIHPISKLVSDIEKLLPNKEFSIVGHSLGGILALLIAQIRKDQVFKVATISSPLAGSAASSIVKWIMPSLGSVADLAPSGKMIQLANQPIPQDVLNIISTGGSIDYFRIGKNDSIVSVESQNSYITDHKSHIDLNHFEILQSPETAKVLSKFLFGNDS